MTRAQQSRAFHASYPLPAQLYPFKYSPAALQSPISTRAPAATSVLAKIAAEIRAEANPPLQRLQVLVSSSPGFGIVLRSRRNLPFTLYCSVLVANLHRTLFQGRRPPIVVASP